MVRSTTAVVAIAILLSLLVHLWGNFSYRIQSNDEDDSSVARWIPVNDVHHGPKEQEGPKGQTEHQDRHTATSFCRRADQQLHFVDLFHRLKPAVFNHTLTTLQTMFRSTAPVIHDDLNDLQKLWDPHVIAKATINPLPPRTLQRILAIINRRLQNPNQHPPLEVMVFGGSIVLGNGAGVHTGWNLKASGTDARWSTQLQDLLNHVLFHQPACPTCPAHHPDTDTPRLVVNLTNMANGGMTAGMSALPLQYGIFPEGHPGPDLIVASFGYNDMMALLARHQNPVLYHMNDAQKQAFLRQETQRFVRAALGCRQDLPAVLLLDDTFMIPQATAQLNLLHSRHIAEITAWYDIWGVSWTKAFLHHSYSHPKLDSLSPNGTDDIYWPLWGSNLRTAHPGVMFHVGIAWLLYYQVAQTTLYGCHELSVLGNNDTTTTSTTTTITSTTPKSTIHLDPRDIPPIHESTMFQSIPSAWINATNHKKCYSRNSCPYFWIANRATNIKTKEDVKRVIDSVMVENRGWNEEGSPIRKPRPGWVASQPRAVFSIQINVTTLPIHRLTLLYLKSYGAKWEDSRLRITVRTRRRRNNNNNNDNGTRTQSLFLSKVKHDLVGFHNSNTSVNYEATIPLDAHVGDTILATFHVASGKTFRINGMLFCQD